MVSVLHRPEKDATILARGVLEGVARGDLPNMELALRGSLGAAWGRKKKKNCTQGFQLYVYNYFCHN
jgi:hypothetical protein